MKITVLLDYPDDATPGFTADMELRGGKVEAVQFSDLFQEHETLEEEARPGSILDPMAGWLGLHSSVASGSDEFHGCPIQ